MRVLWLFTKWLVVPAVLAALGYFVLGPKLGDVPAIAHVVDDSQKAQDSKPAEGQEQTNGVKRKGDPQVIVVRRPGGTFEQGSRRRSRDGWKLSSDGTYKKKKKKRRSSRSSAPLGPGPEIPPPDNSGGGGGGDTGGSTGGDTGGSTGGIG